MLLYFGSGYGYEVGTLDYLMKKFQLWGLDAPRINIYL